MDFVGLRLILRAPELLLVGNHDMSWIYKVNMSETSSHMGKESTRETVKLANALLSALYLMGNEPDATEKWHIKTLK